MEFKLEMWANSSFPTLPQTEPPVVIRSQTNLVLVRVVVRDAQGNAVTSPQRRLVKSGGRLVKHARYHWLLLTESHLTRRLFGGML